MGFGALPVLGQLSLVGKRVNDPRGSIPTGVGPLDDLLYRRGLQPGLFCILGGRTHTRKTTTTVNLIARQIKAKRKVGFITLDETQAQYVLKLMSALYGVSHEYIEEHWNDHVGAELRERYMEDAKHLTLTHGYRPTIQDLDIWLEEAELETGERPEIVYHDYGSLMAREKFDGGETQRVMRMFENLQVWTNENELVTVVLHQLNRDGGDEGAHPVKLSDLKHGGEEIADIVMATYRPALDEIGSLEFDQAEMMSDKELKYEDWEKRRDRVQRYENSTMLQLLKNRPGTKLNKKGIELLSVGDTMQMRTANERNEHEAMGDSPDDGPGTYQRRARSGASQGRPRQGAEA